MKFKLNTDQINYLNIGLMIVAAISAFIWPFETFLFAYAFLGPLHYLTEISWLHDKKYFTKRRYDYLFLIGAGIIVTLLDLDLIPNAPASTGTVVTYIAFMGALVFVLVENWGMRLGLLFLIALSSALFSGVSIFDNVFGAFVPTLIHVFIFTGLFILVGALKGRNLSGILSLLVFIIIGFSFFYVHPSSSYQVTKYAKKSYGTFHPAYQDGHYFHYDEAAKEWMPVTDSSKAGVSLIPDNREGFVSLNNTIREVFNVHQFSKPNMDQTTFIQTINDYFYRHPVMLSIMAFIAFAYLYHYLNWFSKTSVIQWHNIPRARFVAVIIIWVVSLGLYAYNYSVGLKWLFFLSFTHVLLEFPLNNITFINIGKEIGAIFKAGSFAKPATPVKHGQPAKTVKAK